MQVFLQENCNNMLYNIKEHRNSNSGAVIEYYPMKGKTTPAKITEVENHEKNQRRLLSIIKTIAAPVAPCQIYLVVLSLL